jgi:hypothetical protein
MEMGRCGVVEGEGWPGHKTETIRRPACVVALSSVLHLFSQSFIFAISHIRRRVGLDAKAGNEGQKCKVIHCCL